ncbi:DUF1853 family protein [Cupriavidus sp. AU9028]|uniref:DUF1853 family protein n=1 Tax=Cupriavidus sp. AU9028 TaxID=2871157 RepID=UPI001C946E64|nr:DUF1853 family protein [Cupriavidus sp. AU9028]MBY4898020.1 DUF1853 family protein [Cupriavidus sp. AU9028]
MREPPTEAAAAGATTAQPLWRAATSARVRDLAWCTMSPPLLRQLPAALSEGNPVTMGCWPAGALGDWSRWLAQADPEALPPTIEELSAAPDAAPFHGLPAARRSLRLGRHAERLLQFALEHAGGLELLAVNLPIRRPTAHGVQTLGELDFVWRERPHGAPPGPLVHWEMATKFYLLVPPDNGAADLQSFVGPNLVDRLGDKLAHIVQRQLPLSGSPEAQALLGAPVGRSEIYLLGWLFYPDGVMPPGLDALGLHPAHLRGWWSTLENWARRAGAAGAQGGGAPVRWHRLSRARWLSQALAPEAETESFASLHAALAARFAEPQPELAWRRESPVMICEMEPAGPDAPGWWCERSRGFVVPPGWEERARERAAQPNADRPRR